MSAENRMRAAEQGRGAATAGVPALSGAAGGRDGGHATALAPGTRGASLSFGDLRASGPYGPHSPLIPFAPPDTNLTPTPGPGRHPAPTPGKLLAGVAWAVLLLGLWLWGRDLADGVAAQLATTGDVAAAGRPLGRQAPPHAHAAAPGAGTAEPVGLTIDALGVREGGIVARDLDEHGILTPPPDTSPALVGWYAEGPQPGEAGAALLVGRGGGDRDPRARQALVHRLTALKPGERMDIQRSDGSTARFTVEDVQLYDRDRFDAHRAYAARDRGRSELRLIVDDGGNGHPAPHARGNGASNVVVVSAYLTSLQAAGTRDG